MPPIAPARAWFLAATLSAAATACSAPPPPEPTKVTDQTKNLPLNKPRSDVPSPFRHPANEAPSPRSEPQLAPAELEAAIADAATALAGGDEMTATVRLRACANKVPQSIRCEGELAMLLSKHRRHKAEARYYIDQALAADDPGLDEAYYRRLGLALKERGLAADSLIAFERMMQRITPTAADWWLLSEALQGVPDRTAEAAEAARKAYELDPTQLEWLRVEAILVGRAPDKIAQSIALFEEYKSKVKDPEQLADADRKIAELRALDRAISAAETKQRGPTGPRKPAPG